MGESPTSNAVLLPGMSMAQFIVCQLLDGALAVQIPIEGKLYSGYVHNLDYGIGETYVFAYVHILKLDVEKRVAIYRDGTVQLLPDE